MLRLNILVLPATRCRQQWGIAAPPLTRGQIAVKIVSTRLHVRAFNNSSPKAHAC